MTESRADLRSPNDARPPPGAAADASAGERLFGPLTRAQIVGLVCAAAAFIALVYGLAPILSPFVFAAIVAYIGSPFVAWGQRHRLPRAAGALAVMLLFIALWVVLLLILVPMLRKETATLFEKLPGFVQYVNQNVLPWLSQHLGVDVQLDASALRDALAANKDTAQSLAAKLFGSVTSGGLALVTFVANLLLMPIVMFYLLRDWNTLFRRLDDLVPTPWRADVRSFFRDIDTVLSQFLRGELTVMLTLAAYYSIALAIAGLDFALPVGVLTGLLVFIPYVGFGLGLVLAILASLLQFSGWPGLLAVLAVYGGGQVLEGFFLTPRLVGHRIGLHPLAVIFALLAFAQLLGFIGVLLALPISATLVVALRRMRERYVASDLYRGN